MEVPLIKTMNFFMEIGKGIRDETIPKLWRQKADIILMTAF
jgi:hypothetical protein